MTDQPDAFESPVIRTVIIDSDEIAGHALQRMLVEVPDVVISGTCTGCEEAIASIDEHRPDLLFLEVELPDCNGFTLLRQLPPGARLPAVVFMGARDTYVANAIETSAVDYLLKPVQPARLELALRHYRARRGRARAAEAAARPESEVVPVDESPGDRGRRGPPHGRRYIERLLVKSADKRLLLLVKDIDNIVTQGNYLRLQAGGSSYRMRGTLNEIEEMLDPTQFLRVHRAALVNVDRIQEFSPWFNGEYLVILKDGSQMKMSRGCRDRLFKRKAL